MLRQRHVVVAVDAQDFLDDVAFAGHVNHIGRGGNLCTVLSLLDEVVAEGFEDGLNHLSTDADADELFDAAVVELDLFALDRLRVKLLERAANLAAGAFEDEMGSTHEGVIAHLRVGAALEAEGGVGLQALAL